VADYEGGLDGPGGGGGPIGGLGGGLLTCLGQTATYVIINNFVYYKEYMN
jgi:hypothetical protein